MKITDLTATAAAIPIEAPLRTSGGIHPGRFQRTILQLHTDEGLIGLGEGGGGDLWAKLHQVRERIIGEDPFHLERIRHKILSKFYSRLDSSTYATIEMACLDLQGKVLERPLYDLLGGPLRQRIPFAAYLFYRYKGDGVSGETTPQQMVELLQLLVERYRFRCAKLKGGVFPPERDIETCYALREAFGPHFGLRLDPNAIWSVGTAMRVAKALEDCDLEYLEDPTSGMAGMARVHQKTQTPLATNMCVINFDDFPAAIQANAVDVILADIYYWGGITGIKHLSRLCETFRLGLAMHSSSQFGLTLAATLHVAATLPNLIYAADAHYHHLTDDIIVGGRLTYEDGSLAVPSGPGLGVDLDQDKLTHYAHYYQEQGDYATKNFADEQQPSWFRINPAW